MTTPREGEARFETLAQELYTLSEVRHVINRVADLSQRHCR
jgi:hypothetical protein